MKLSQGAARLFVPDGREPAEALARTTHLGVGAHPDDLELMTWHGIGHCSMSETHWFTGVVVTSGSGSPRAGRYAGYSDDAMRAERWNEQTKAATIGRYAAVIGLAFESSAIGESLVDDLERVLRAAKPEVVYTHNLFDAHDTHLAVAIHVVRAIRALPSDARPRALYGCEVWRSLDWLPEGDRLALDVSGYEELGTSLAGVYQSQIAGGKRYDLATLGRKRANATYAEPHDIDRATAVEYVMDMSALIDGGDIGTHVAGIVERVHARASARLRRWTP